MNFFEWHGFLPSDRFERSIIQEIIKNRKRTEASIAIIKDIEKNQTKPTTAMLQSLFEQPTEDEEDDESFEFVERKFSGDSPQEEWFGETTIPKIRYERLEDEMGLIKEDFTYVLDNVKVVKSSFSKNHLRLELSEDELIKFRRIIENI